MISKNKIFLLLFCLFFLFANFYFVGATNGIPEDDSGKVKFVPQIGIPGSSDFEAGKEVPVDGGTFIKYLKAIYVWAVGAIAIIAIIMIMIAGFQWMTAAGNASVIGQARARIGSSLIGLLLAIGAYSLLNFVNPSLVNLRTLDLGDIKEIALETYETRCNIDIKKTYTWPYHRCFAIGHDDWNGESFPISDFFIGLDTQEIFKSENIDAITFRYGVDTLQTDNCNANDNFSKMAVDRTVDLTPPLRATILCHGRLKNQPFGKEELYENLGDDSAGLFIELLYDNDSLSNFYVEVGNKSPGEASAFFSDIEIVTNAFCSSCCKKNDTTEVKFVGTLDCSSLTGEWTETNSSECCNVYSRQNCTNFHSTYPNQLICQGLETFCNRCHWNKHDRTCSN